MFERAELQKQFTVLLVNLTAFSVPGNVLCQVISTSMFLTAGANAGSLEGVVKNCVH